MPSFLKYPCSGGVYKRNISLYMYYYFVFDDSFIGAFVFVLLTKN